MNKFLLSIIKFGSIGVIPFFILSLFYFIIDPFKVIYEYDSFVEINQKAYVELNRDYVSTKTFDNNYQSQKYNSFIFGNSRSIIYQIYDWKKQIGGENRPYHFDASSETLYGLQRKVLYVDSIGGRLDNVLLVLDKSILKQDYYLKGVLYEISPQLINNKNFLSFHFTYLKAYFSPRFFIPITYFKLTNKLPFIFKGTLDYKSRVYDSISNELQFKKTEESINAEKYYTNERRAVFYKRSSVQKYSSPCISITQKKMLNTINEVFVNNKTNYKIIISPLYDQLKIDKKDLLYLNNIFGEKNVFDFSGINIFTNDYKNYYETSHYRPHVANEIMKIIYQK